MKLFKETEKKLDLLGIYFLFPLLLLDMLNGILYMSNLFLPISVSQLYKLLIILFFCVRLMYLNCKVIVFILVISTILFFPTLIQYSFYNIGISVLYQDLVRTSKYLIIIVSYSYFRELLVNQVIDFSIFYKWVKFSFWVLALNLLVKLIGLGYPMYSTGNIGTKGFFIAGNEVSALLIVLSSIVGYYYLVIKESKFLFLLYAVLSFVLGLLISSKTGMLGVVLVYSSILASTYDYSQRVTRKQIIKVSVSISVVLLTLVLFILNTSIFGRYFVFWNKLDFVTFILSSRNIYFQEAIQVVKSNYEIVDYIIGVGPTVYFEMMTKFVEIDFIDVFFSYGILGLVVLSSFYVCVFRDAVSLLKLKDYPFVKLTMITFVFLIMLSLLSGHILNSGIAGIFIGFVFALMYQKK